MNYSFIVIDDKEKDVEQLLKKVNGFANYVCKGVACSVEDGISLTLEEHPNFIFLNSELKNESGFEIIKHAFPFFNQPPFVILISEGEKDIKKAINHDVLFCLDKPIESTQLIIALTKFKKHFSATRHHLTIKDKISHRIIRHQDILYIQSDSSYCHIHRINDKIVTVTKTLKEIENLLPNSFLRIHRSYIINTAYAEIINTTLKTITLHYRTSLFEVTEQSKIRLDESFTLKSVILELPIGDIFLERVKQALLTFKLE
jgi:DNA-binding LytR/AlgR family response regulator